MDPIEVENAIVREQAAFSPGFKLLRERWVEAAHRTGAWGNTHQCFCNVSHFMGTGETSKHLRECFCDLWFITAVALKCLAVKHTFAISWHAEILKTPCFGHQVACVGAITISLSRLP
jgi:hypothetical protein